MKKEFFIIPIIIILALSLYALTIKGVWGQPGPYDIKGVLDQSTKPLELSPERGRYSHVFSLAEDHTYTLSYAWAHADYPDVGVYNGNYYSFFAPGISYYATPFFILGSFFNLGQVFAFGSIALISAGALVFVFLIARRIYKLPLWAALFAVLVFGFGSTALSYATTLYQHQATVFLLLSSFYAIWKYRQGSKWSFFLAAWVWLAYGLAVFVDYPNAVFMIPVLIYLAISAITVQKKMEGFMVSVRWSAIVAVIAFVLITGLQFAHNQYYYGSWHTLAGGLATFHDPAEQPKIIATTTPALALGTATTTASTTPSSADTPAQEKDVAGFFKEQDLPNGLYTLLVSSDRGLFFYCPIFLFAFIGLYKLIKQKLSVEGATLLGIIAANLFLYASWGDPWGGWAFGPRYLIVSMAPLSILVAIGVTTTSRNKIWSYVKRSAAFILFGFSSAVAIIGALTTNAVPPKSEGILLPVKQYNYFHNFVVLKGGQSGSFLFNTFFSHTITAWDYFLVIYSIVLIIAFVFLFVLPHKSRE